MGSVKKSFSTLNNIWSDERAWYKWKYNKCKYILQIINAKLNLRLICSEFKDKIKKIFSKEKIQSNEKNE